MIPRNNQRCHIFFEDSVISAKTATSSSSNDDKTSSSSSVYGKIVSNEYELLTFRLKKKNKSAKHPRKFIHSNKKKETLMYFFKLFSQISC